MPELKVCRVCLNKDVTMYKYDRFQLKCFYEEIMAEKVHKFCAFEKKNISFVLTKLILLQQNPYFYLYECSQCF